MNRFMAAFAFIAAVSCGSAASAQPPDEPVGHRVGLASWYSRTDPGVKLSLIHISEPTRLLSISYAVFCLKKKKNNITVSQHTTL